MSDLLNEILSHKDSDGVVFADNLPEYWIEVDDGAWEQNGKYQCCSQIVQHLPSGRHFMLSQSRSGSPFTDWDYGETDVDEVKKEVRIIEQTVWTAV
jgi:hypothetical protein